MEPETWIDLIKALGYPTAVSVVMGAAIWRFLKWCAPRADRFLTTHLNAVDKLSAAQESLSRAQDSMSRTQNDIKELIVSRDERPMLEEIHRTVTQVYQQQSRLTCQLQPQPNPSPLNPPPPKPPT